MNANVLRVLCAQEHLWGRAMPISMPCVAELSDLDMSSITGGRSYHPSPTAWEDEIFYFLMLDRFSDGREYDYRDNDGRRVAPSETATTPTFAVGDAANAIADEGCATCWRNAGAGWCGGTLKGMASKIGYLRRLGISALWVSPIFKQVSFLPTYHGYGIQNYLDVDPHFGTRQDLCDFVAIAHAHGIRVVLDIVVNHSGNVFSYEPGTYCVPWDGRGHAVKGFNDRHGHACLAFAPITDAEPNDDAVWPRDFQHPETYSCRGCISNWDNDPEYLEGDFCDLKDVHLGDGGIDDYRPSPALLALCEVYKYWIALADIDGFRLDTVKHMDPGAVRFFTAAVHEFAQSLGKDKFYIIGEITGGRARACDTMEATGLDAALGIDDIPDKLEWMTKGWRNPSDYFDLFRNSLLVGKGAHTWFRDRVMTMIDDHDQVRKGNNKARFSANGTPASLALAGLALNATTLGIACVYYGSEQAFDGEGGNDSYIRECMFGGAFGAFRSQGRHFFDEDSWLYREFAKVLTVRREQIALRRGRQYLREISGNGTDFGVPHMIGGQLRSVVAWSRILDTVEVVAAINTDTVSDRTAWVGIDAVLHARQRTLRCLYSTDASQIGGAVESVLRPDGRCAVSVTVPPAGFVLYR